MSLAEEMMLAEKLDEYREKIEQHTRQRLEAKLDRIIDLLERICDNTDPPR
jgi:hypothetical protein